MFCWKCPLQIFEISGQRVRSAFSLLFHQGKIFAWGLTKIKLIVKPESKSPIPCPNRSQILTKSKKALKFLKSPFKFWLLQGLKVVTQYYTFELFLAVYIILFMKPETRHFSPRVVLDAFVEVVPNIQTLFFWIQSASILRENLGAGPSFLAEVWRGREGVVREIPSLQIR